MSNQAAKQEEKLAVELFDNYWTERLAGNEPSVEELLAKCPTSQTQDLLDAIQGAEAYIAEYLVSYVHPSVQERLSQGLEAIKHKRERQTELRE
jgi:hypothetical protein